MMIKLKFMIIISAIIIVLLITTIALLNSFYVYHEENDISELEHIVLNDYREDIRDGNRYVDTENEIIAIESAVRKIRFYPIEPVETNDLGEFRSTILFKYKDGRRRTINTYENISIMAFSTGAMGVDRDTIKYYRVNSNAVEKLLDKFLGN